MQTSRIISRLKSLVVRSGVVAKKIPVGLFRGLTINLDFQRNTQLYLGLWEFEIAQWFKRWSSDLSTFVDIGSASGWYTLYGLARTTAKEVYIFEPDRSRRAELVANLDLNGLRESPRLVESSKRVGVNDSDVECRLDSLDIENPALIKIDVDGPEVEVLQGATRVLQMPDVRWIIETHSKDNEIECENILREAGHRTIIVKNGWWRRILPEVRPIEHNRWLVSFRP